MGKQMFRSQCNCGASSVPEGSEPRAEFISCIDCGVMQEIPPITTGRLQCWRCGCTLERATSRPRGAALALALSTLMLLVPANLLLLLRISKFGLHSATYLSSGIAVIWVQGWAVTAIVIALLAVVLPFARFGLLTVALSAALAGYRARWVGRIFRYAEELDLWAMPDVFLIGCAIGFGRLSVLGNASLGDGGWCFLAAALLSMLTRATIERRRVWRSIGYPAVKISEGAFGCPGCQLVVSADDEGGRCPRCAHVLWRRRPSSTTLALALTATGLLLYPIANLYSISNFDYVFGASPHTLFSSVAKLVGARLWFLAACIFTTSIAIPFVKLVGMLWFIASVHRRSSCHLLFKTRLYRAIDELGRWSTMDVFTVVVYIPLLQFGQLATVNVGRGLPALLAVVMLTMLASRLFDPRLLWDGANVA